MVVHRLDLTDVSSYGGFYLPVGLVNRLTCSPTVYEPLRWQHAIFPTFHEGQNLNEPVMCVENDKLRINA